MEEKEEKAMGLGLMQGGEPLSSEDMKKQGAGLQGIIKRALYLEKAWRSNDPELKLRLKLNFADNKAEVLNIAYMYADLENDFRFIKETAEFTAQRYAEVMSVLPTLEEVDLLLEEIQTFPEEKLLKIKMHENGTQEQREVLSKDFFRTEAKEDRIKKLEKLRSAIFAIRQQG